MNTIFLVGNGNDLYGRITRWLTTNLITNLTTKVVDVGDRAPDQTISQFIAKERQMGARIFTGISDGDMQEIVDGPVGQMDVHRIAVVSDGADAADFGISTFIFRSDINDYDLFVKLTGIKRLVTIGDKHKDDRPKLPWQ